MMNTTNIDPAEIAATRRKLVLAGYKIIPAQGKNPGISGWQNINASPEDILQWDVKHPRHTNTGALTANTPTVDIDVMIESAANAVEDMLRDRFGARGQFLVRCGKYPKRAVPFRTKAPFKKIAVTLTAPDGTDDKIEILGEGQQFIVHGVHPDTREPYAWSGGELWNTAHESLPTISEQEARDFVNDAAKMLVDRFGYQIKAPANGNAFEEHSETSSPHADVETLRKALDVIPNNGGWDDWNNIGMALWRATGGSGGGFALFDEWSQKWSGYNQSDTQERWSAYFRSPPTSIGAGTIFHIASQHQPRWRSTNGFKWEDLGIFSGKKPGNAEPPKTKSPSIDPEKEEREQKAQPNDTATDAEGVSLTDFFAYMPSHSYIFMPAREPWPAGSVNSRIDPIPLFDAKGLPLLNKQGEQKTVSPSQWLDRNRPVEQMTWAPGYPAIIQDRLVSEGGWINRNGVKCLNLYRPPTIKPGDASKAGPWVDHIRKIYPSDADHIIMWLAFKVQKPQVKINHAIVLGGSQGIGKDTLLEPVKHAIGPWNFTEVSPTQMIGRFNGFVKSVILRVSEARDLGDVDRFQFYDHMKVYTAAPPDVLRVDEKHLREHSVFNVCGVVLTTNHKGDGIYLPSDDRRHYVAWSDLAKESFTESYWNALWGWYEQGGIGHVVAHLSGVRLVRIQSQGATAKDARILEHR